MNDADDFIKTLRYVYVDLIKETYEAYGFDLGKTENDINYKNNKITDENGNSTNKSLLDTFMELHSDKSNGVDNDTPIAPYTPYTGGSFDPTVAASIASKAAAKNPKSTGKCAKYVANALQQAGFKFVRRASAYMYKDELPRRGWHNIANLTGVTTQRNWEKTNVKKGDISVMSHKEHGHIAIWDGNHWVSDFIQHNMWVYSDKRDTCVCNIFRFE